MKCYSKCRACNMWSFLCQYGFPLCRNSRKLYIDNIKVNNSDKYLFNFNQ